MQNFKILHVGLLEKQAKHFHFIVLSGAKSLVDTLTFSAMEGETLAGYGRVRFRWKAQMCAVIMTPSKPISAQRQPLYSRRCGKFLEFQKIFGLSLSQEATVLV